MSNLIRLNKVCFVFAVSYVAFILSGTAAACSLWDVDGGFTVTQDNGYAPVFNLYQTPQGIISGSANYEHGAAGFGTTGTVAENSNISGDQLHVVIQWDNNTRGSYIGKFNNGKLSGSTCDEKNPGSCAKWTVNNRNFACLRS